MSEKTGFLYSGMLVGVVITMSIILLSSAILHVYYKSENKGYKYCQEYIETEECINKTERTLVEIIPCDDSWVIMEGNFDIEANELIRFRIISGEEIKGYNLSEGNGIYDMDFIIKSGTYEINQKKPRTISEVIDFKILNKSKGFSKKYYKLDEKCEGHIFKKPVCLQFQKKLKCSSLINITEVY